MSGKRVLVVNDTQEILELFADLLGEMGLEVVQMSYAPRELDRIREVAPDLIILDFLFGEGENVGWQLLQKLKMDRKLARVPIVVCTAAIRQATELQGYLTEQGIMVVIKPFNVDQLEEAITKALTDGPTARGIELDKRGTGPHTVARTRGSRKGRRGDGSAATPDG
jgi:CheY-like chemotaxis protein